MGRTRGQPSRQEVIPQETTIRSRLFNVFEITLLFAAVAAGGVTAVTVALTKSDFQGDCPLFAEVEYTNRLYFRIDANPSAAHCDFCIVLQVFISVVSLLLVMLRVVVICTKLIPQWIRQRLRLYFMIPFFAATSFTVLAQASIITAGLNTFCRGLMDATVDNMRCWMFQPIAWSVYDGSRFFNMLSRGMIASWCSFLVWAILTTSSCLMVLFSKKPTN